MTNIAVFTEFYLPGFKAGGPIRSIANMVDWLGSEHKFHIITRDRDLGDQSAYPDVSLGVWLSVGLSEVMYLPSTHMTPWKIGTILQTRDFPLIYLNGFFNKSTRTVLLLRATGALRNSQIIVAPRGEFSSGALAIKRIKKSLFIKLAQSLRLYKNLAWQASSEYEKLDIETIFGQDIADNSSTIHIAPNLPARLTPITAFSDAPPKQVGAARIVFVSRISRMKNLDYAVELLKGIEGQIRFDIYGPLEDEPYWQECQRLINQLPANVIVEYKGPVNSQQVAVVFAQYHLLLLPTRGENFGHVILEALSAGCPVLISDQTPWHNLSAACAGWEHPLTKPEAFQSSLGEVVDMDQKLWECWSSGARRKAETFRADTAVSNAYRLMFSEVLGQR